MGAQPDLPAAPGSVSQQHSKDDFVSSTMGSFVGLGSAVALQQPTARG